MSATSALSLCPFATALKAQVLDCVLTDLHRCLQESGRKGSPLDRLSKDGKNQKLWAPFREVFILQVFMTVGYPWFKCTTFEFQLLHEIRRRRLYHPTWDWNISTQRHRRRSGYIFGKNSESVWK